jgi:hypothetical protein
VPGTSAVGSDAATCDVLSVIGSFRGRPSTTGVGSVLKINLSEGIGIFEEDIRAERLAEGDATAAGLRGTLVHRKP